VSWELRQIGSTYYHTPQGWREKGSDAYIGTLDIEKFLAGVPQTARDTPRGLSFLDSENGWLEAWPSQEDIALAKRERDERDVVAGRGFFGTEEVLGEHRWVGGLVEMGVEAWLRQEQVPFVHNGGVDMLPDFEIVGVPVGVKTRTMASASFRAGYVVNAYEYVRRRLDKELLFGVYELHTGRLLIVGGLDAPSFYKQAVFVPKGGRLHDHSIAGRATWNLGENYLHRPADWLRRWSG
jgi:hypothetical protein